ncbi:hypothetical protein D3C80_1823460 [compost metagenome]
MRGPADNSSCRKRRCKNVRVQLQRFENSRSIELNIGKQPAARLVFLQKPDRCMLHMNSQIEGRILADHLSGCYHQRFCTRIFGLIDPVAEAHNLAAVVKNTADPRFSPVHRADLLQHRDDL